jgi:hypothetical protein
VLDANIDSIVSRVAGEYGLPREVWLPIIMYESGGDPNVRALTQSEDSRGLFQVNTYAHPTANASLLYDPEYNARWQIPELARFYEKGLSEGYSGVELTKYVAKYGQRPMWTDTVESNIEKYYGEAGFFGDAWQGVKDKFKGGIDGAVESLNPFSGALDFAKITVFNVFIFGLLLFSLYMVFVNKTIIGEQVNKAKDKAIKAGLKSATGGVL